MAATLSPWIDQHEWRRVYKAAYSGEERDIKQACSIIKAWNARSSTALPFPIESTLDLLECWLLENNSNTQNSDHVQGLAYAMALIRFVNGVNEYGASMGMTGSILDICGRLGVPSWLIEARHAASHGLMPPLSTVRVCMEFAMTWLKEKYWSVVSKDLERKEEDSNVEDRVVVKLIEDHWRNISSNKATTFSGVHNMSNHISKYSVQQLIHLIKTSHFLGIPPSVEKTSKFDIRTFLSVPLEIDEAPNVFSFPSLPNGVCNRWKKLISACVIAHYSFLTNLVSALIQVAHGQPLKEVNIFVYGSWIGALLNPSAGILLGKAKINWSELFQTAISNPGPLLGSIASTVTDRMLADGSIDKSTHMKLKEAARLVTLSERVAFTVQTLVQEETAGRSHYIFSNESESYIQDFKALLLKVKRQHQNGHNDEETNKNKRMAWCISRENIDWKSLPLGEAPNGTRSLELPSGLDKTVMRAVVRRESVHPESSSQQRELHLASDLTPRRMTTLSKYLDLEAIQGEDPSNNYANLSPQTVEQVKINIQLL